MSCSTECIRESGHDGPCNGYPRWSCPGYENFVMTQLEERFNDKSLSISILENEISKRERSVMQAKARIEQLEKELAETRVEVTSGEFLLRELRDALGILNRKKSLPKIT